MKSKKLEALFIIVFVAALGVVVATTNTKTQKHYTTTGLKLWK